MRLPESLYLAAWSFGFVRKLEIFQTFLSLLIVATHNLHNTNAYGFSVPVLTLVHSYLSQRKQYLVDLG